METKHNASSCCFLPETKVKLPNGETTISAIQVGQDVMSYDLKVSRAVVGRVTRVDIDSEPDILNIDFDNGDGLICTPSQRLWQNEGWILAGEIRKGTRILGMTCKAVERRSWGKSVFTLVVERWNNYIVLGRNGAQIIAHDNSSDLGYPPGFVRTTDDSSFRG